MTTKPFYIYKLISSIDRKPFYVGKGRGRRMYDHVVQRNQVYKNATHKNHLLKNKINKLISEGGHVIYHSRIVASEHIAFSLEKRLIAKYGRRDNHTGILCNMTDGGEGVSGHQRSQQWREASRTRAVASAKSIDQYSKDGKWIKTWLHYKDACTALNVDASGINRCCNGKIFSAGGFRWTWSGKPLASWLKERKPRKQGYHAHGRQVHQFTIDGEYIATHHSLVEAGRAVDKHANTILECCKGRSRSAGGFKWSYKRDIIPDTNRTVFQYDLSGNFIAGYITAQAASAAVDIDVTYIQRAIRTRGSTGGFYWSNQQEIALSVQRNRTTGKSVVQLSKMGDIIAHYASVCEAVTKTQIKGIPNCVTGRTTTAGGFLWKYL